MVSDGVSSGSPADGASYWQLPAKTERQILLAARLSGNKPWFVVVFKKQSFDLKKEPFSSTGEQTNSYVCTATANGMTLVFIMFLKLTCKNAGRKIMEWRNRGDVLMMLHQDVSVAFSNPPSPKRSADPLSLNLDTFWTEIRIFQYYYSVILEVRLRLTI